MNGSIIESSREVAASYNRMGFDIFGRLYEGKNICISSPSIGLALTMAYNGARGRTKEEMGNILYFKNKGLEEINQGCQYLLGILGNPDSKVIIEIANSLWVDNKDNRIMFEENFLRLNREYLGADMYSVEFGEPEAADWINRWVSEKTHGKINKIIEGTSKFDVINLVNALYSIGKWKNEFSKYGTKRKPFYLLNGDTTECDMMRQGGDRFLYLEEDGFQAVAMPCTDEKINMYLFLPSKNSNINDFLNEFTPENYREWFSKFQSKRAKLLAMPRFKHDYGDILNSTLVEMGMKDAFNPNDADLTGISKFKPLFLSNIIHKTSMDVNEAGFEGAAVTAVMCTGGFGEPPPEPEFEFVADRPFVYTIQDNETGIIIFTGAFMNP